MHSPRVTGAASLTDARNSRDRSRCHCDTASRVDAICAYHKNLTKYFCRYSLKGVNKKINIDFFASATLLGCTSVHPDLNVYIPAVILTIL